ncbi:MAG: hypothetical protein HKP48_07130 [Winogradskyella sp.]|uniref:hypothetical protein n=1 Tax=Winogradskyella sp. TaxID=1883156 RepID=UPI00182B2976|nr:hypothetical protein [Winogradskyella sp.]MBT8245873.1 hypothetical protein [Winogradskyella sp.]NNK23056.1 hypothetical protein [Winogradskyella sp.]
MHSTHCSIIGLPNKFGTNLLGSPVSSLRNIDTLKLYNFFGQLVNDSRATKIIDNSKLEKGIYI